MGFRLDQIRTVLGQIGRQRLLLMGGIAAALLAVLAVVATRGGDSSMGFLYTDLDPSAAQSIAEKLKAQNVAFQLSADGTSIMAPEDKLAELRMGMAGEKLGGKIGYDVLDEEEPFGVSASRAKMNETRAIEGELARSVETLQSISRARGYAWSIARSRIALSIVGEPKTGRTMLARSIHAVSRRGGRFLIVDATHGTPAAIEAELFGRAAGESLPPRRGKLDEARGGTLFLREVDRLPLETQTRLAHALASGHADTRIIASAHADLAVSAAQGTVRADLAARLGTVRIALPPLRDRVGDIPALAAHFAEQAARVEQIAVRPIADAALALLARHSWPCNVQELEDVVHRATVLARGPAVGPDDLVLADGTRLARTTDEATPGVDRLVGHTVEDVERALILKTLERCRGNRTSASGILGISVRTMRNKLKSFVEAGIAIIPAT